MSHRHDLRDRHLIGIIGDQVRTSCWTKYLTVPNVKDTITGMLLAGVGNVDTRHKRNFFLVDQSTSSICYVLPCDHVVLETQVTAIEEAFDDLTTRRDIAVLLINQHVTQLHSW